MNGRVIPTALAAVSREGKEREGKERRLVEFLLRAMGFIEYGLIDL